MPAVVYLVDDLFFVAKIRDAAAQVGVEVERAADPAGLAALAAAGARLAIVDLRRGDALAALERLAADPGMRDVRTVGFVDHERVDAMESARAHGCAVVLSKRRFATDLPGLLAACRI
jgi:hypothetical protein